LYRLSPGPKIAEVFIDDISEVIKDPENFLWIGIREVDDKLLLKIQEEFGLHELAVEDARKAHQLPKLESYEGSLFIVAKTAMTFDESLKLGEAHLFIGRNFLITIRHGPSTSFKKVRERCEKNPQKLALGAGFGLYSILDDIVDHYALVLADLRQQFQSLESGMFQKKTGRLELEQTYELKRELMSLRDAASPIVDICNELMRFHEDMVPEELHVYLRDVQDHCKRVIKNVDNMREMLMSAMQVNLALVSIGQNDIVRKLAGWGAILAIPTVVFSLYGMNFRHMPELQWRYSYFTVIGVTVIGCGILYRKLKKSGWL
jgi:magnesium transporter